MVTKWSGTLAPLGVPTGDGRRFKPGSLTARDVPLPLRWQRSDEGGHDASVVIGTISDLSFLDDGVDGAGTLFAVDATENPRLAEDVSEVRRLLTEGVIGPSVDLDDFDFELVNKATGKPVDDDEDYAAGDPIELEMLVTKGRISAATLVPIPAFAECRAFTLTDETEPDALAAALTASVHGDGWGSMPLAARDAAWDASTAEKRVASHAGVDGDDPDWTAYGRAFLWFDPNSADTKGGYRFQIADYDGGYKLVPRAVFAAAGALQGARGGTTVPQADQDRMRSVLGAIYDRMADEFDDDSIRAPWDDDEMAEDAASVTSPLVASGGPVAPPLEWFARKLDAPTRLTVEDDGRVYGHLAEWNRCHTGVGASCVLAPHSASGYAMFHTGYVRTQEGDDLPVGVLTLGGGHADTRLGYVAAVEHYDDAGTAVAVVRAWEDEYGIAVAGSLVPGITEEQVAAVRRAPLSGDWRQIGGQLELVAALAVNTPGFPVTGGHVEDGRPVSLVAAGVIIDQAPAPAPVVDTAVLSRAVADGLRLHEQEKARAARTVELAGVFAGAAVENRARRAARLAATFKEDN